MGAERLPIRGDETVDIIDSVQPTLLHELDASGSSDIDLELMIQQRISRQDILRYDDRDERARFVLGAVLEGVGITRYIEDLFDPLTRRLPVERRPDVEHMLVIEEHIKNADKWYAWYVDEYGKIEAGDRLDEMLTMAQEQWLHTDLYRAFDYLRQRVQDTADRQQREAVILAHRTALIMMAQATSGYTITDGER